MSVAAHCIYDVVFLYFFIALAVYCRDCSPVLFRTCQRCAEWTRYLFKEC